MHVLCKRTFTSGRLSEFETAAVLESRLGSDATWRCVVTAWRDIRVAWSPASRVRRRSGGERNVVRRATARILNGINTAKDRKARESTNNMGRPRVFSKSKEND